jgi:hypothetical protein
VKGLEVSDQIKPLRSTAPKDSILSPQFIYRNSAQTDVAATFARVRAQQAAEAKSKITVPVLAERRRAK